MTASPTPAELTALRTAHAAVQASPTPNSNIIDTVVFALGAAQLLQSPETAAELTALRERVAELETFAFGCDGEGCVLPHSSWCDRARQQAEENGGCTCPRAWPDGPHPHAGYCWLVSPPRGEVDVLRKRVAELEALTPAPIQDCQICGSGYTYGEPCSVCEYRKALRKRVAELEALGEADWDTDQGRLADSGFGLLARILGPDEGGAL